MKKLIFIVFFASFLLSCAHKPDKEKITLFILYGHSGWCFIDSTKWIFDSTSFDIRQYFEFKNDSSVKVALRKWKKETEYFKITEADTLGLSNVLDKLVTLNLRDTQYYPKPHTSMYDGYFYTIHVFTSFNKNYKINYIPDYLPTELVRVHDLIRKIIYSCQEQTGRFPFNAILKKDAVEDFKTDLHPPPRPDKIIQRK